MVLVVAHMPLLRVLWLAISLLLTLFLAMLIAPAMSAPLICTSLLTPTHLVLALDRVIPRAAVSALLLAQQREGEGHGRKNLAGVEKAREGADAEESALVMQVLCSLGVRVAADDVGLDVVGVVEENGEGDHEAAADEGWDAKGHVGFVKHARGCEGRWVDVVEDPEDDLHREEVSGGSIPVGGFHPGFASELWGTHRSDPRARYQGSPASVGQAYLEQKVESDHQLECEQLGERLVAGQLMREHLIETQNG